MKKIINSKGKIIEVPDNFEKATDIDYGQILRDIQNGERVKGVLYPNPDDEDKKPEPDLVDQFNNSDY